MITRGPLYGFRTCLSALQGSAGVIPLVQKVMNGTDLYYCIWRKMATIMTGSFFLRRFSSTKYLQAYSEQLIFLSKWM
jgi:hypothetical protein